MNLFAVSLRNLAVRRLSTVLTMTSIAVGSALLASLWLLLSEAERKYTANVKGYGLVVGPKEGSSLDLVLSTVFNFSELAPPTGLLPMSVYRDLHDGRLRRRFAIRYAIPQCRGDNYKGFPVIGTTDEMFSKFSRGKLGVNSEGRTIPRLLEFEAGVPFEFSHEDLLEFADEAAALHAHVHQSGGAHDGHDHSLPIRDAWRFAVIGSSVSRRLGLTVGDSITPVHGVADEITAHVHEEARCEIIGVLAATGAPLDRSVFIPAATFLAIDKHDALRESQESEAGNVALSAVIVDTVRPAQFGQKLRYEFQTRADAQAAVPWFEVSRLLQVVGNASDVLRVVSYLVLVVAGISILVALYNTMNERRREIAIMRSLGARRIQIVRVILQEALIVSAVGGVLGVALCHFAAYCLSDVVAEMVDVAVDWSVFSLAELWLILGVAVLGGLAGILPAIKGSRTPVADHLGPVS